MITLIFSDGARLVEDFLDQAEETAWLEAIDASEWSHEIGRRVQHYGFRYDYSRRTSGRTEPAAPFPAWATAAAERLEDVFGGTRPEQCIVNEYLPGQGIGMHADGRRIRPRRRVDLARGRLADALPAALRAAVQPRWARRRQDRHAAGALGARADRSGPKPLDARNRPPRQPPPSATAASRRPSARWPERLHYPSHARAATAAPRMTHSASRGGTHARADRTVARHRRTVPDPARNQRRGPRRGSSSGCRASTGSAGGTGGRSRARTSGTPTT